MKRPYFIRKCDFKWFLESVFGKGIHVPVGHPRYWNIPVLVNTGTFLVYQYCPKMWYLHFSESAGAIQNLTITGMKNTSMLIFHKWPKRSIRQMPRGHTISQYVSMHFETDQGAKHEGFGGSENSCYQIWSHVYIFHTSHNSPGGPLEY